MKQVVENVCDLRYNLQIAGIPFEDPAFVYGDNKVVLANTTVPGFTLNKNMKILSHHFVYEGFERSEWRTAYVNTNLNLDDLPTKPLPSVEKKWGFVRRFLYWI